MKTELSRTASSFDLTADGRRAGFLAYNVDAGTLTIEYVEVDPALRGKGLGEVLVDAAVAFAAQEKLAVVPICGYARAVLRRRERQSR